MLTWLGKVSITKYQSIIPKTSEIPRTPITASPYANENAKT